MQSKSVTDVFNADKSLTISGSFGVCQQLHQKINNLENQQKEGFISILLHFRTK